MMDFWQMFISDLYHGLLITLQLLAFAIPISIILGTLVGVARIYGNKLVSYILTGYVAVFKGLPMFVTILLVYFGISNVHIPMSAIYMAIIAFVISHTAYISDVVRGAIRSIDVGQSLAAQTLGMTRFQEVIHIIIPQAARLSIPGVTNDVIHIIKGSSLAYIIGVAELFSAAKSLNSIFFYPNPIFGMLAAIYLAIIAVTTIVSRRLEKRLEIPGIEIHH